VDIEELVIETPDLKVKNIYFLPACVDFFNLIIKDL
jgi:hypothetical protein